LQKDRTTEWFVPKFGPRTFRIGIGILFLPYTGMVVSFAAWGSLAGNFSLERLVAICLLYFLATGISAHFLDAIGSRTKPWGILPTRKLWTIALISLGLACVIGLYYALFDSPLLIPIGIIEGFFLFAYNLELFGGKLHNNASFVVSWGILPVLAGSAIQTNSISFESGIAAALAGILSYILIKTSRQYKELKRDSVDYTAVKKKEITLKIISIGVMIGTVLFFILRYV
jgi:hypothetical protein